MKKITLSDKQKAFIEAIKEPARWIVLFVASWIVTETLKQINLIPEYLQVNIWILSYSVPIRLITTTVLTLILRTIDRYMHELGKLVKDKFLTSGLTRF